MNKTHKLTSMAMLAAISVVLVAIVHFPIFPAAPYLEYDPADIPILVSGFAFGPVAGIIVTIVVSVVQGVTVSSQSGIYGILMHLVSTGVYVTVSSLIYTRSKTRTGAFISIIVGALCTVIVMIPANLVITPLYGTPLEAVKELMLPIIIPFNAIKMGINGIITFFVYKSISRLLHKWNAK